MVAVSFVAGWWVRIFYKTVVRGFVGCLGLGFECGGAWARFRAIGEGLPLVLVSTSLSKVVGKLATIWEACCGVVQVYQLEPALVHNLAPNFYQDWEHCGAEFWLATLDGGIATMPAAWHLLIVSQPEMAAMKATQLNHPSASWV